MGLDNRHLYCHPITTEEECRLTTSAFTSPRFRFSDLEDAQEYYYRQGMTDGLPIILPTEDRVTAMLEYVGLGPGEVVATEEIRGKKFTAEKVAVNSVMAGCRPEYMPVVIAAVQAMADPDFNLHDNNTSTDGVAILDLVSGPIARDLGINSGTVAMGYGFRANATIGRALGLIKINAYGSVPHQMDKSTFGHPGQYSFCFAENDDTIPWEPLRLVKGVSEDSSTVTIVGAGAPLQVSTHNYSQPDELLTIVSDAMLALGVGHEEVVVVLGPEVLEYVRRAGWTKHRIKEFIFQRAQRTGEEWNVRYRALHQFTGSDLDRSIPAVKSPDNITVVGAGGSAGPFASIIGSWGSISSITKEINQAGGKV